MLVLKGTAMAGGDRDALRPGDGRWHPAVSPVLLSATRDSGGACTGTLAMSPTCPEREHRTRLCNGLAIMWHLPAN